MARDAADEGQGAGDRLVGCEGVDRQVRTGGGEEPGGESAAREAADAANPQSRLVRQFGRGQCQRDGG